MNGQAANSQHDRRHEKVRKGTSSSVYSFSCLAAGAASAGSRSSIRSTEPTTAATPAVMNAAHTPTPLPRLKAPKGPPPTEESGDDVEESKDVEGVEVVLVAGENVKRAEVRKEHAEPAREGKVGGIREKNPDEGRERGDNLPPATMRDINIRALKTPKTHHGKCG